MPVRRVGDGWEDLMMVRSDLTIIDSLDFTDPDGQEIISRQETPAMPARSVSGERLRSLVTRLALNGTREVMLVSSNDAVSQSWQDLLQGWGVDIRWDEAASDPWRSWFIGDVREPSPYDINYTGLDDGFAEPRHTWITSMIHSPAAQLLLTLTSEYSDTVYGEKASHVTDDPQHVLIRTMRGMPIGDRLKHTGRLLDDLERLGNLAGKLHRALGGTWHPKQVSSTATLDDRTRKVPPRRNLH